VVLNKTVLLKLVGNLPIASVFILQTIDMLTENF